VAAQILRLGAFSFLQWQITALALPGGLLRRAPTRASLWRRWIFRPPGAPNA
jgi:hypothetical protein